MPCRRPHAEAAFWASRRGLVEPRFFEVCSPPGSLPPGWPRPVGFPEEHPGRRPPPSTLCLCPSWFCRRRRPLFGRSKTAIQKRLTPVQLAFAIQFGQELPPDFEPRPILFPKPQTPPAGARAGVSFGQVLPAGSGFEHPKDAFQNLLVVGPETTKTKTQKQQQNKEQPLFVREEYVSHPQLFTYSS